MLDRRREHFRIEEIAYHWAREPDQRYSADDIWNELVASFWRGEFKTGEVGWDADIWNLRYSFDKYPPEHKPDNHDVKPLPESPASGDHPGGRGEDAPPLQRSHDLRGYQGERASDFEEIDRSIAFEYLCAFADGVAKGLLGSSETDTFNALAKILIADYDNSERAFLETLTLKKNALKRWCEERGTEIPHFARSAESFDSNALATPPSPERVPISGPSQTTTRTMQNNGEQDRESEKKHPGGPRPGTYLRPLNEFLESLYKAKGGLDYFNRVELKTVAALAHDRFRVRDDLKRFQLPRRVQLEKRIKGFIQKKRLEARS